MPRRDKAIISFNDLLESMSIAFPYPTLSPKISFTKGHPIFGNAACFSIRRLSSQQKEVFSVLPYVFVKSSTKSTTAHLPTGCILCCIHK